MSKEMPCENNARANRCAIYARSATAHQADGSVDEQIACCREFAARRGWEVLNKDVYVDSGISGVSKEHPALNELIATAASLRPFGCVLVVSVDRLARSLPHYLQMRCKLWLSAFACYLSKCARRVVPMGPAVNANERKKTNTEPLR